MTYQIILSKNISKIIAKIDPKIGRKIIDAINDLAKNPRPNGYIKLTGEKNAYRTRIGKYRIVYEIYDSKVLVVIIKIGHRKDIYEKG